MEAYQQGDRTAADQLIDSLSPALYRFFAVHAGDRRHADDLLQEAWLRVHKARHTYRPGEPLLPWLYAIARHTKVDAFRRRRPFPRASWCGCWSVAGTFLHLSRQAARSVRWPA